MALPTRNLSRPDPLLALIEKVKSDPRPDKCDLGLGVYCTGTGATPVFQSVKAAEQRLLAEQSSKSYLGLFGNRDYLDALTSSVLGPMSDKRETVSFQTPGGSSALSLTSMLVAETLPQSTIWLSRPGWPNYERLLQRSGLRIRYYRYLPDPEGQLDIAGVVTDLREAREGDVVVLQASGHNPTGRDPSASEWAEIATCLKATNAMPLIDIAYQGLAKDPETDMIGVRKICAEISDVVLTVTQSKNFGLYRERTGALIFASEHMGTRASVRGLIGDFLTRLHAMPPDHGAAVVAAILADATLRTDWTAELTEMRGRLSSLRTRMAATLPEHAAELSAGRGLFTLLPLSTEQIAALQKDHAIYLAPDGRLNLSGIQDLQFHRVSRALAKQLIPDRGVAVPSRISGAK